MGKLLYADLLDNIQQDNRGFVDYFDDDAIGIIRAAGEECLSRMIIKRLKIGKEKNYERSMICQEVIEAGQKEWAR